MTAPHETRQAPVAARPGEPWRRPRATWVLLIAVLFVHAAMATAQPFLAGVYLSGEFDAIAVHGANGGLLTLVCALQFPIAVLFWRPGRGPWWPAVVTPVLFVAEGIQAGMGSAGILGVHIPLGVAIVGGTVAMFIWSLAWRPRPPYVPVSPPGPAEHAEVPR